MQSGPLDIGNSAEFGSRSREKNAAAPVVGTSSATPTSASAAGAQVELQIVAVNLSSATSAASAVRTDEQTSKVDDESPAANQLDSRQVSAASLELSARAQRLALIPAQVMDPEELAHAKKEVEQAEEQLARVQAGQKREERQDTIKQAIESAHSPSPLEGSTAQEEPMRAKQADDGLAAATPPKKSSESASAHGDAIPPSRVPHSRPDPAILAHGRSPFESSTPRATGQSLDIVVGQSME